MSCILHCLLRLFLIACAVNSITADNVADTISKCGSSKGCWLMPPGCEQAAGPICTGIFSWTVTVDGFNFLIEAYVADLRNTTPPTDTAYYGAVAFSLDPHMGDDTVITCSVDSTGFGAVLLAWNDQNHNYLQLQASEVILSGTVVSLVDDRMECAGKFNFDGWQNVVAPNRLFDLSSGNLSFNFLFARGMADPRTHAMHAHSLWDGARFPWITSKQLTLCPGGNCTDPAGIPWLTEMHQSTIPRFAVYTVAVFHGAVMTLATFVLIPTGVLMARFTRSFQFHLRSGSLWFQVHRGCMLTTFVSMSVALLLIYWQANFSIFTCSVTCSSDDYQRYVHAWLGTLLYLQIAAQVICGVLRPPVSSEKRRLFNWFHTLNGIVLYAECCANCILAISLGKTGLARFYDKTPNMMFIWTVVCFVLCFAACEWIVHRKRYTSENPDRVEQLQVGEEGDTTSAVDAPSIDWRPAILIAFNFLTGLSTFVMTLTMIVRVQTDVHSQM